MSSFTLDQFRAVLDHLDPAERADQLLFFRILNDIGQDAVAELGPRLLRVSASRGFRQLVFEGCFYYPWPAWVPILARALRRESDPELFSVGVVSLGNIGDAEALAALKELSQLSSQPGSKEVVADVLAQADPSLAWDHHLERLLEGSGNPSVANEGARQLGQLVDPSKLSSLQTVLVHPDLLIFRHGVRLLSRIQSAEGAAFLAGYLEECHREVLEDRTFKEVLPAFKGLGLEAAREAALGGFSTGFAAGESEVLERLRTESGAPALLAAQGLRDRATGPRDRFMAEILVVVAENKSARVQVLQVEALEEMNLRSRRLAFAMDAGAEGLAGMVKAGHLPLERALPILEAALRLQTGREGVARALAALAPAANAELMDLLIHLPDNACRVAALEVLGERREEALRPVLLAVCRDPISDIAQRAMVHLGSLPGAEQVAGELLRGGRLEDIQLGIRFIGLHKLTGLAQELLDLVRTSTREELAMEALEALGSSGSLEVAPALIELLHSGQSPQMQLALAQALRDMGDAGVAETLCSKAEELKNPILHAVALEALVRTQNELDPESSKLVMAQVLGAWEGRRPWANRMKIILALPELRSESRKFWADLASLVQSALAESKTAGGWSSQELGKLQPAAREISRRAAG
jgi:hypothetical protein